MEANYLYHHHQQQQQPPAASSSFYVDPFNYLPNSPIEIPLFLHHQNGELLDNDNTNASSSFTISYQHSEEAVEETPTSSDLDVVVPLPTPQSQSPSLEKKRKKGVGICLTSSQSKGGKESKGRRKISNGVVNGEVEKKKSKLENKELKDTKASINHNEEPASGYIHVRARGGQATDSHSLAERVRRERISERMKKLQGLVPGCDNVIGKALVLDEIINYVQSLKNQVEFLSMKLASVHPILYGFGLEDYMIQVPEEMGSISQAMPSLIQTSHTSLTAFEAAAATHSLQQQMIDHPPPPFPLHPHGPTQGSENFLVQVGDQIRGFELNNMSSFQ